MKTLLVKCPPVQWQPADDLTIRTKKWFLGAGVPGAPPISLTVGFHSFNLRIFNLRVANPNKLIVDVCLTRCRISMCQGLGTKKHYDISEIDRMKRQREREEQGRAMMEKNDIVIATPGRPL